MGYIIDAPVRNGRASPTYERCLKNGSAPLRATDAVAVLRALLERGVVYRDGAVVRFTASGARAEWYPCQGRWGAAPGELTALERAGVALTGG